MPLWLSDSDIAKEPTIQRFTAIGLISILTVTLAACGNSSDSTQDAATATGPASVATVALSPTASTEAVVVDVSQFKYSPAMLEITTGTTVTWTNTDQILHTVTTGTPDAPDGYIDGQMPASGTSFSFTFTEPGTYDYFCARHAFMTGTVVVR